MNGRRLSASPLVALNVAAPGNDMLSTWDITSCYSNNFSPFAFKITCYICPAFWPRILLSQIARGEVNATRN